MKKNTTTPNNGVKLYSVMVGYDAVLYSTIWNELVSTKKIKPQLCNDTYFYINCMTEEELTELKKLIEPIKFEMKNKDGSVRRTYKIRYVSAYKQGKLLSYFKDHLKKNKKSRPGANTAPKKEATEEKAKIIHLKKRKAIKNRGTHNSGTNMTSTEIKLVRRAKKAGKAIISAELRRAKQKAIVARLKPKNKASKTAKQLELPLAA